MYLINLFVPFQSEKVHRTSVREYSIVLCWKKYMGRERRRFGSQRTPILWTTDLCHQSWEKGRLSAVESGNKLTSIQFLLHGLHHFPVRGSKGAESTPLTSPRWPNTLGNCRAWTNPTQPSATCRMECSLTLWRL